MARKKRRPNPAPGAKSGTLVCARKTIHARIAADIPMHIAMQKPASNVIEAGTTGILIGPARGAPELRVVEFEASGNTTVRVEVFPADLEIVATT